MSGSSSDNNVQGSLIEDSVATSEGLRISSTSRTQKPGKVSKQTDYLYFFLIFAGRGHTMPKSAY